MIRVIFPQNAIYFIILSFSVQKILTLFKKCAQKFTYRPSCSKVKYPYTQYFFVLSTERITVMGGWVLPQGDVLCVVNRTYLQAVNIRQSTY
jgi:hypothetical protein